MDGPSLDRGSGEPTYSLIFPTYNPGSVLHRTWRETQAFLAASLESWEILFVCDGCTDGTPDLLSDLMAQAAAPVRLVSYAPNRGKGYAVRQGLAAARGQWRLFTDVDLAYGFDDVARVARALREGADLAIASRAHPDSVMTLPVHLQRYAYWRHLQSSAFSQLVRWLLPLQQRDTQAGLKGVTANVARNLLPLLKCDGFVFDCELLTAAVAFGFNIREIPVGVRYDERASTTDLAATVRMVGELWSIRNRWREWPVQGGEAAGPRAGRQAA
jgi:dolichyl-phosphate beta-glucosyltransferase